MKPTLHRNNRSVRLYRAMLIAYPRGFRQEYADSMVQVFQDLLCERSQSSQWFGVFTFWLLTIADLFGSAVKERLLQLTGGDSRLMFARWGAGASLSGGIAWICTVIWLYFFPDFDKLYLATWICATLFLFTMGLHGFYRENRDRISFLTKAGFYVTLSGLGIQILGYGTSLLIGGSLILDSAFFAGIIMLASGLGLVCRGCFQEYGRFMSYWGKLLPAVLFGLVFFRIVLGAQSNFALILCFVLGFVWVNMGYVLFLSKFRAVRREPLNIPRNQ